VQSTIITPAVNIEDTQQAEKIKARLAEVVAEIKAATKTAILLKTAIM